MMSRIQQIIQLAMRLPLPRTKLPLELRTELVFPPIVLQLAPTNRFPLPATVLALELTQPLRLPKLVLRLLLMRALPLPATRLPLEYWRVFWLPMAVLQLEQASWLPLPQSWLALEPPRKLQLPPTRLPLELRRELQLPSRVLAPIMAEKQKPQKSDKRMSLIIAILLPYLFIQSLDKSFHLKNIPLDIRIILSSKYLIAFFQKAYNIEKSDARVFIKHPPHQLSSIISFTVGSQFVSKELTPSIRKKKLNLA